MAVSTWVFVDLDGVVNIGIRDDTGTMLDFSAANLRRASRMQGCSCCPNPMAQRLLSVSDLKLGHGEGGTCTTLRSSPGLRASHVLVDRLAKLINAAGRKRKIVLTSAWRLPEYANRVSIIEEAISESLGEPFVFDDRTPLGAETTAEQRLAIIGKYIAMHCTRGEAGSPVRVLVLEDFFATPLNGWTCDGSSMFSAEDVEHYLHNCFRDPSHVLVSLVHTYDEWTTITGLHIQIGSGLTMRHYCKGLRFFGQRCEQCEEKKMDLPLGRSHLVYVQQLPAVTGPSEWKPHVSTHMV
mmetsp:Transcript_112824/g.224450  ORF Transcript_112824/g.224450 Transcript_112824/m.224450 type:complete len:296 (+) Transcript_112824:55-942(+)